MYSISVIRKMSFFFFFEKDYFNAVTKTGLNTSFFSKLLSIILSYFLLLQIAQVLLF